MGYIDYTEHFHHPANNFATGDFRGEESEYAFANKFTDEYNKLISSDDTHTVAVRELPMSGYGIPDLVMIRLKKPHNKQTIQSFEFKLSNWRAGLMQAHRYKYFSNTVILVIPHNKMKKVQEHIELFHSLNVGLWGFHQESGSIIKRFTPRSKKSHNIRLFSQVMEKTSLLTNQS
ncbi:MAG: hypothetical protein WCV67_07490 [Victivallaceae bacterium]|jgi:hypothetical protein